MGGMNVTISYFPRRTYVLCQSIIYFEVIKMSEATTFTSYPDIAEVNVSPKDEAVGTAFERKIAKRLKKQNKLLKRLAELHAAEERRATEIVRIAEERRVAETTRSKQLSFLTKVEDAFVKALPTIVLGIATIFVKNLFFRKNDRAHYNYQRGYGCFAQ